MDVSRTISPGTTSRASISFSWLSRMTYARSVSITHSSPKVGLRVLTVALRAMEALS